MPPAVNAGGIFLIYETAMKYIFYVFTIRKKTCILILYKIY